MTTDAGNYYTQWSGGLGIAVFGVTMLGLLVLAWYLEVRREHRDQIRQPHDTEAKMSDESSPEGVTFDKESHRR